MNEVEIRQQVAVRNAVISQLNSCGMRPLEGSEAAILAWFQNKGCKLSADHGYLEILQADASAVVPSAACETLRKECPHLFVADPRRDEISSLADFRGTQTEVLKQKASYITKHGQAAYENLPRTAAEAQRKSVAPSANMTAAEYRQLTLKEKAQLTGILHPEDLAAIMRRK
ncbi:MAG: hypothetical protein WAL56_24635 [Candidatus Sulfotelmatobacter sp.]